MRHYLVFMAPESTVTILANSHEEKDNGFILYQNGVNNERFVVGFIPINYLWYFTK